MNEVMENAFFDELTKIAAADELHKEAQLKALGKLVTRGRTGLSDVLRRASKKVAPKVTARVRVPPTAPKPVQWSLSGQRLAGMSDVQLKQFLARKGAHVPTALTPKASQTAVTNVARAPAAAKPRAGMMLGEGAAGGTGVGALPAGLKLPAHLRRAAA